MADAAVLSGLEPVVRVSIADQVFDALHQQVLSLALPPGTRISETEIATQLCVSRQPVRDAFYRLSQLGFLVIQPQRATQVSQIQIQDVRKARFIRVAIEVEVLQRAAVVMQADDFAALEANMAEQAVAVAAGDRAGFHKLDDAFHSRICVAAGVGFVWGAVQDSKAHTDRLRYLSLAEGSARAMAEHGRILAALRARDAAAATLELRGHLGQIEQVIAEMRASHPQWFSKEA